MDLLPIGLLCNIGQYNRWVFPNDPDLCIKNSKQLSRHAIKNDNIVHLEFLTKAIMKIKRCKKCIKSLTLLAARYGSFDCLQWLIDHDFPKHELAIMEALKHYYETGNTDTGILQLLLHAKFLIPFNAIELTIEHKDTVCLKLLVPKMYLKHDYSEEIYGQLLLSCMRHKFIEGFNVLLDYKYGDTPIAKAIIAGDTELVRSLATGSINPNIMGFALLYKREECIKILIDAGHYPNFIFMEYAAIINYRPGLKLMLAPIDNISFEYANIAINFCPELFAIILEFSPHLKARFVGYNF